MKNLRRDVAIVGVVIAAACAHRVPLIPDEDGGSSTGFGDDGGNGTGAGGSSGDLSQRGDGSGRLILPPEASDKDQVSDGAPVLAGMGSVGLCASGRTCDPKVCDELEEAGQHEYVEQHPDDGSQIPFKDVPTAQQAFRGTPSTASGPCIVEPPDGSLFPNNWVRARIRVKSASTTRTIYRITVHADRQMSDLIVYTESNTWEIPKDIWTHLAASTWDEDITVTVDAIPASGGGARVTSQVKFKIAPAFANGAIIYWAATGKNAGQSWLEGFGVGDENVAVALTVPQAQWRIAREETGNLQGRGTGPPFNLPAGSPACVGCHVAVPDRQSVTFIEDWPWDGVAAMVDPADTGKLPPWLTPGGAQALSMPWLGMMSFSPHLWNDLNQHIMVVAMQNKSPWSMNAPEGGVGLGPFPAWGYQGGNDGNQSPKSQLGWIDLSTSAPAVAPVAGAGGSNGDQLSLGMAANYGTSWGILARNGDPLGAAAPTWSHLTGDTVVYTSTNASMSGRVGRGLADLWSVPYAGGAGGTATPIPGASETTWNEYYPSYSPDDKFVAFNRTPVADDMYYDPNSEIFVIPAAGGMARRLNANDAPACMGVTSPGINNSWAKWAPEYPNCNGLQYYWLIFSSSREKISFTGGNVTSQLYLTALVTNETGSVTSYPGVYIWNQHTTAANVAPNDGMQQSNHTPQWEGIDLPPPPAPPPPPPPQPPQ